MASPHGTTSRYANGRCRCARCRRAWREGTRRYTDRLRAGRLAAGLTANGAPRARPYDERALALIRAHGLEPDPRFVP